VVYLGLDYDEFDINGNNKPADQANGVAYLGGTLILALNLTLKTLNLKP
jgi:hypothetical protein